MTTQIKPYHFAIAGLLGFAAVAVNIWPQYAYFALALIVVGGAAAAGAWHIAEKVREQREAQARAAGFANVCGPVLITSIHPNETVQEVEARATEFRQQLRLCGNAYAEQIPIVCYPYQPMIYGPAQLTAAWNIYQSQAGAQLHAENLRWADACPAPLKPIFLSQVMPAMGAGQNVQV